MPLWQFIRPQGMNGPESPLGVSFKMLPDGNVSTFVIQIQTPAGTALPATNRVALEVGRVVARQPLRGAYRHLPGAHRARCPLPGWCGATNWRGVRTSARSSSTWSPRASARTRRWWGRRSGRPWSRCARQFPETHIMLFLTPPGPPTRAQVVARIYGPDYEKLRQTAGYVSEDFKKVYGMTDVHDSVTATHAEYRIRVNQRKAMLSGRGAGAKSPSWCTTMWPARSSARSYRPSVEPEDIIVRLDQADRAWIQQIQDLSITNAQGHAGAAGRHRARFGASRPPNPS